MSCGGMFYPTLTPPGSAGGGYLGTQPPDVTELGDYSWVPVEIPIYNPVEIPELDIDIAIPGPPVDNELASVDAPYSPPDGTIAPPSVGEAPTLDVADPDFYLPTQPEDFTVTAPGDAPTVSDVTIPDAPTLTIPDLPAVSDINEVTVSDLSIPLWDEEMPVSDIDVPANTFTFTEEDYSSTTLTETTTEISRMLAGGVGIPDSVWQQIYEKGADREEETGTKLVNEATSDFAARGWSSPGGALNKRIRQARQAVQDARNTLARDITIKQAEMELDNLRFAIAQALALDGMMIQLHNSVQDRAIRAAEIELNFAIQLMNAKITLFNAELQAYQTAASVFKTLVEAEVAKLEVAKTQIQAEGLKVEVDKARIDAYQAQIQGLTLAITAYNAQIAGVQATVEVEKTKVEAYRVGVQAYGERVKAWATEWDGYKTIMDGNAVKADIYGKQVQAYASEVDGFQSLVSAEGMRVEADAKALGYYIDRAQQDVGRYTAETQYQAAKVSNVVETYKAQMSGYQAHAAFNSSKADLWRARLGADIENAKAVQSSGAANAQIYASQFEAIQRLNLSANETMAKIQSQLAASELGQFSASTSQRATWSTSSNYSCT